MRAMAGTAVAAGVGILILMIAATVLSVTFATRGAMATNKPVIEVLHFVGAKNGFIAGHFQRHFLLLGLQGGAIGGGAAILLFALAGVVSRWFAGTAGGDQTAALFGSFSIGVAGYIAVLGQVVLIAAGDGDDLAADGQPHPGGDRLTCSQVLPAVIGFRRPWPPARVGLPLLLVGAASCWFVLAASRARKSSLDRKADGIVVLTGGRLAHSRRDRIAGGRARQAAADHRRVSAPPARARSRG